MEAQIIIELNKLIDKVDGERRRNPIDTDEQRELFSLWGALEHKLGEAKYAAFKILESKTK